MQLDPVDRRILEALRDDARLSFRTLSARVGVSTPTVASRVRALEAAGILRGYHARVAPGEGQHRHWFTLRTRPADAEGVAREALRLPGAIDATLVAGGIVHVRVHADDAGVAEIVARLTAMEALHGFEHGRILEVGPEPVPMTIGPTAAVACHTCGGPVTGAGVRKRLRDRTHVFCCRVCAATMEERYAKLAGKEKRERGS